MLFFGAVQVHMWAQSGWWYRAFVMTLNIRIYTLIDRILKTISNIKFHKLLGNKNVITIFFTNSWEHKIHGADRVQTQDKDSTFWRFFNYPFRQQYDRSLWTKGAKTGYYCKNERFGNFSLLLSWKNSSPDRPYRPSLADVPNRPSLGGVYCKNRSLRWAL